MKTVFWNVDTQHDFMDETGALYVPGAEAIKPALATATRFAKAHRIQVVNTADWHTMDSEEISDTPDYKTTFPPHCIRGTLGAEYIDETRPGMAAVCEWDKANTLYLDHRSCVTRVGDAIEDARLGLDVIIRKDKFDVFAGNPHTEDILAAIDPGRVVVYGVATNVCVDHAVQGLLQRGKDVYYIEDAIAGLPGKPYESAQPGELIDPKDLLGHWKTLGAKAITTARLEEIL